MLRRGLKMAAAALVTGIFGGLVIGRAPSPAVTLSVVLLWVSCAVIIGHIWRIWG